MSTRQTRGTKNLSPSHQSVSQSYVNNEKNLENAKINREFVCFSYTRSQFSLNFINVFYEIESLIKSSLAAIFFSFFQSSLLITAIMIILYCVVALVALIYFWFKKKFSFWENHGFPSVPGKIPMGSVGEMGFKYHSSDLLKRFYDENKEKAPALGLYFMTQPVLMPTDPELVKDILVRNFESFHDRGFYFNEKDDPLSGHLVTQEK